MSLRAWCLATVASWALVPVSSSAPPLPDQVPEAIVMSGEERAAIVRKFQELVEANQGLAKALVNCKSANRT